MDKDGRLMARYRDGQISHPGYADDYTFLICGLIELYETTYKPDYLRKALSLNEALLKLFWDEENGGLFIYGSDREQLIARPKEVYDGAAPSGNSVAAFNLIRLARLTGQSGLEEKAHKLFKAFGTSIQVSPTGYSFLLSTLLFALSPAREIVLVSQKQSGGIEHLIQIIGEQFRPFTLSMHYSDENQALKEIAPYISDYKTIDGKTAAYVCENFACKAPVTEAGNLRELLQ
jgi:uncharacterized protein YyaL (SSP411 family)